MIHTIIPTRERPALIGEQVRRIEHQMSDDDRLTVVIDGCPATEIKQSGRVSVIRLADAVGVDRARQIGTAGACADAIIFEVDDHDLIQPGALDSIRKAMEIPSVVAAYSDVLDHVSWMVDGERKDLTKRRDKDPSSRLADVGFLGYGCRIYRKWAYDAVGGYPLEYFPANDYALMLKIEQLFGRGAIRHIDFPLVTVEHDGRGVSEINEAAQSEMTIRLANIALNGGFEIPFDVEQSAAVEVADIYRIRHIQFSLATGVRNRIEHLRKTIPAALAVRGIRHVVVADFGSKDGTLDYLKSIRDDRLVIIECQNAADEPWNYPRAMNTAWDMAARLGANVIGLFDCDVILDRAWAEACGPKIAEGAVGARADKCPNGCGWTGTQAARADVLQEIGGYDERMLGWGHQDIDCASRLAARGHIWHYPHSLTKHIDHGDDKRGDRAEQGRNRAYNPLRPGQQTVIGHSAIRVHTPGKAREYGGGLLYVVEGDAYRRLAEFSIQSARIWNPGIEVAVVGAKIPGTRHVAAPDPCGWGARAWKVRMADMTPFERTVFLDADTVICGRLDPLFDALDRYDVALALDPSADVRGDFHLARDDWRETVRRVSPAVPHYNTGVIAWKADAKPLFDAWADEWRRFESKDQGAFMRAVETVNPRLLTLGAQWNGPRDGSYIWHRICEGLSPSGIVKTVRDLEGRVDHRFSYMRGAN